MKKGFLLCLILAAGLLLLQCSNTTAPDDNNPDPSPITETEKKLVEASNAFGLKLFREISTLEDSGKNIFISPLSISFALGMTYNGADGATKDAMAQTLEISNIPDQKLNQTYRDLMTCLMSSDPDVLMQVANSIWYRQGFPVYEDFINTNRDYFDADIEAMDFSQPGVVDLINSWADENTNGKITKILDNIPPEIIMYLINAVYFKAAWTIPFAPDLTVGLPFIFEDNHYEFRDYMMTDTTFRYFENDLFQAVELPYGNKKFSMIVFLPREEHHVDYLISQMTDENLAFWLKNFVERRVGLSLPKFRFSYDIKLNDALSALGMGIAFSHSEADFGRMAPLDQILANLYIDMVKHKAFVQVDEEGTEASAVTIVSIGVTSIGPNPAMYVNRPFMFIIRDHEKGSLLFMGKVGDPVWEN